MLYAIKTPEGELLEKTVSALRSESWDRLLYQCRKAIPKELRKEIFSFTSWQSKERNNFLRKHGFACVHVKMIELQDEVEFS